jgi:hypothetical protein
MQEYAGKIASTAFREKGDEAATDLNVAKCAARQ